MPLNLPFLTWTIEDAKKAAASLAPADIRPIIDSARKFYDGDHWQGGAGWIGPHPGPTDDMGAEMMAEIEYGFVSRNVVKEVVDRHARGVIGIEPDWGFTPRRAMDESAKPSAEEQTDIDTIEAVLTEWWDKRKAHAKLKDAIALLLQARRAALRLFVPKGLLQEGTIVTPAQGDRAETSTAARGVVVPRTGDNGDDLRRVLDMIFVEAIPEPDTAAIYIDPATQREVGIVIYQPNKGVPGADQTLEIAELTWLDENGRTVIRVINPKEQTPPAVLDLGKHILLSQIIRKPLITDQVLDQQKALNHALTMVPRTVTTAGFLEQTMLNAQMPGMWLDENGEPAVDISSRKRFEVGVFKRGAGIVNWVRGMEYEDPKDNSLKLTDPQIHVREPAPVTPSIEAKRSHYVDMLEETDQIHILLDSQSAPSGRSRQEARADYISSLNDTKDPTEASGRWMLETVLAFAEALLGRGNNLTARYRATFTCRLNAGPLDPAEIAADEASIEKGTLSDESAMQRRGILDVDAEKTRINSSDRGRLDILKRQGEAMKIYTDIGLSLEAAAEIVIEGKKPMTVIRKDVVDNPPDNLPENQPGDGAAPTDGGAGGDAGAGGAA